MIFSSNFVGVGEALSLLENFEKHEVYKNFIHRKGYILKCCIVSYLYVLGMFSVNLSRIKRKFKNSAKCFDMVYKIDSNASFV